MACQSCKSKRLVFVSGKVSDLCYLTMAMGTYDDKNIVEYEGYVPLDMGLGGHNEDLLTFTYCLDCGRIQGAFPLPETRLEKGELRGMSEGD